MPPGGPYGRPDIRELRNETPIRNMNASKRHINAEFKKRRKNIDLAHKEGLSIANISPTSLNNRKRKTMKSDWPYIRRLPADENLVQEDDEDDEEEYEDNDNTMQNDIQETPSTSEVSKCAKATGTGKSSKKVANRGEYYVENADGVATEKYSMVYRTNLLHNYDDIDDDSGDEILPGTSSQLMMSDKWKPEYNNGVQMLVNPTELPKFYTKNSDFCPTKKSEFVIPKKLISVKPTLDADNSHEILAVPQLNFYQGDDLDMIFVKKLNSKRPTVSNKPWLSERTFLSIMNSLEIEAYKNIHEALLKPLHSPSSRPLNEADDEAPCDVCRMTDCDMEDEMVFCEGCNVCVHMSCYGLTELPEGDWLCHKCLLCNGTNPPCVFCPTMGGAMKCTKHQDRWAHVVCALWLPECRFGDAERREPVLAIDEIPDERWQLKCSVCDTRQGACIQCCEKSCNTAFHVTCALRSAFTMRIDPNPLDPDDEDVVMNSFCKKHSTHIGFPSDKSNESSIDGNDELNELEKFFYLHADYEKISESCKLPKVLVSDVYEYWKQKRMNINGKPLIANPQDKILLNLEYISLALPTTSSAPQRTRRIRCTPPPTAPKSQFAKLRESLDKDRNILTMVQRREKMKRNMLQADRMMTLSIAENAAKHLISFRNIESLVEMLESTMKPEEIAESCRLAKDSKYVKDTCKRLDAMESISQSSLTFERTEIPRMADFQRRQNKHKFVLSETLSRNSTNRRKL